MRVFIGYDPEEHVAAQVCRLSLLEHATIPVHVTFLNQAMLRRAGLYWRSWHNYETQRFDDADGKPFSTEFTFTRFLVPALCQWEGWALFCDSDMLWRRDIDDLIEQIDDHFAVQVVKHRYQPKETTKMRGGVRQETYNRKNWSSMMLFNNALCETLTPHMVNTFPGNYLHQLRWAPDDRIGSLWEGWNWLEGWSPSDVDPAVVHYTRGTPDVPGYEEVAYADEWWRCYGELPEVANGLVRACG